MGSEPSDWSSRGVSQDDACVRLGHITSKTLNKYIRDGYRMPDGELFRIRRQYLKVPGRRDLPVYHPDDIRKIEQLLPSPVVSPAEIPSVAGSSSLAPIPRDFDPMRALADAIRTPSVRLAERPFLRGLEQASEYSGLSQGHLRNLIRSGKLKATKHGGWVIRRSDLDALEL